MNEFQRIPDRAAWSEGELATLRQMIGLELPMRYIARKLRRSEEAVRQKAHRVSVADMIYCNVVQHGRANGILRL